MLAARLLTLQGNYEAAVETLRKISDNVPDDAPDWQISVYEELAGIYRVTGNRNLDQKYTMLRLQLADSVYHHQQYGRIRDLDTLSKVKKLDAHIRDIDRRRRITRNALVASVAVLVVVSVMVAIVYVQRRNLSRRNKDLFQKTREMMARDAEASVRAEFYERQLAECRAEISSLRENAAMAGRPEPEASYEHKESQKYSGSNLSELARLALLDKINSVMRDVEVISDNGFNIDKLAELTGSNTTYVSQAINETYSRNFNTLLQEARIKIACARLLDGEHSHLTIEAIADGLGFKSRSNFTKVFTKVTGLSPSQFKKIGLSENRDTTAP